MASLLRSVRNASGLVTIALAGLYGGGAAHATTLTQALLAAYGNNPTLAGQRATARQNDEQAAVARSYGRPQVSANLNASQGISGMRTLDEYGRSVTAGATLTLPVYQGGRVRAQIAAADARAEGAHEDLSSAEGDVFVQTVSAYMDVLRDRAIVDFNVRNDEALRSDLASTNARLKGGELTRTDLDQSRARLLLGDSRLAQARNTLVASEHNFRRLTGLTPDQLDPPPPLPMLPKDAEQAEQIALKNNPELAAAAAVARAAHHDVDQARGGRLPTVSLVAGDDYYLYQQRILGLPDQRENVVQASVTVTLPLYQGGLVSAQVRGQKDAESQAIEQNTAIERQTVADTHAYYSSYRTALSTIDLNDAAVKADALALTGVRIESDAGLRQVLDVLNAELELLNSQVALVSARHDAYVAGFQLLNVMGVVNYRGLNLDGGMLYDPQANYRHAIHSLSDEDDGPSVRAVTTPIYGPIAPYVARPVPAS